MQGPETEAEPVPRLRVQRNVFAALAVCLVASIVFAVPRKVASHRELKALNERLVALQAAIVENQRQTRDTQEQIREVQREITERLGK